MVKRTCRSCGRRQTVLQGVVDCPWCGARYGALEFGQDRTPKFAAESAPAWPPLVDRTEPPAVGVQHSIDGTADREAR